MVRCMSACMKPRGIMLPIRPTTKPHPVRKHIFAGAALLSGLALLAACRDDDKQKAAANQAPPPAEVVVQEVNPVDMPITYEYSGRTAGSREVEVRARVNGILMKRAYTEGEKVKAGQVLFVIDSEPYRATQSQTLARLQQAERNWQRVQGLFAEKAVSARDRDQAQSEYEQARAAAKSASLNVGYTTVVAPISGVTSAETTSEGSLINEAGLLTKIAQMDPIYVNFAYPDSDAFAQREQIASGKLLVPADGKLTATVKFNNGTEYPTTAPINLTESVIDTQTGTVRARAVLPNPKGDLLPGQFIRVSVSGYTRKDAVAIPERAVAQGPQGLFVMIADAENKVGIRPIVLGQQLPENRILVESGLQKGDRVIVDGLMKARPGAPVSPITQEQAAAKQAEAEKAAAAQAAGGQTGEMPKTPDAKASDAKPTSDKK